MNKIQLSMKVIIPGEQEIYTPAQVAELIGRHPSAVYKDLSEGVLECTRLTPGVIVSSREQVGRYIIARISEKYPEISVIEEAPVL